MTGRRSSPLPGHLQRIAGRESLIRAWAQLDAELVLAQARAADRALTRMPRRSPNQDVR